MPRIDTGVPGLDAVLGGGMHAGRVYLLEGAPGTGKTTVALQFLLAGVARDERGLYFALSESGMELRSVATSHGWSLDGIDVAELIDEAGLDPEQAQTVLHPSELELGETIRAVLSRVEAMRPARIVFDSLSELRLLAQNPLHYRRQVLALKQFFTQRRCTVLLLDDRPPERSEVQLHSLAHGVISLEQIPVDYGAERRRMRVLKLRGSGFRGGWHDYTIRTGGMAIFPRLVANEHHSAFHAGIAGSGSVSLDRLLGGGFVRGSNTLLVGPSGVGKSSTAAAAALAALRRGERVSYFVFDEVLGSMLQRSASLGMDLRPHVATGLLHLQQIDPAEMSPGQFACLVQEAVQQNDTRVVVIDSLNSYLHAMPAEKFLLLQMHELLSFLNQSGTITVMILGQHGLVGDVRTTVDLSYLADTVMLLRYFEVDGSVRKAISVMKTRVVAHEATIRELTFGTDGLVVGEPLRGFRGVLTGVPVWMGAETELMGLERLSPD